MELFKNILGYISTAVIWITFIYTSIKVVAYLSSLSNKKDSKLLNFIYRHPYGSIVTMLILFIMLFTFSFYARMEKLAYESLEEDRLQLQEESRSIYDSGYESGYEEGHEYGYLEGFNEGEEKGFDEGYELGKEEGWENGWNDSDIEDVEAYYESLCKHYNLLTYSDLSDLSYENYYVTDGTLIYHCDYFCISFDINSEYKSYTKISLPLNTSPCSNCKDDEAYYYLNDSTNTFHYPFHTEATTNDFLSPAFRYHRVSYESAVAHNAIPCPECIDRKETP